VSASVLFLFPLCVSFSAQVGEEVDVRFAISLSSEEKEEEVSLSPSAGPRGECVSFPCGFLNLSR